MLRAQESRHIFDLARDETSSLRWLTDSESIGTLRSAGTQDLETVHARFDFDSEVFTSRAYRVATRANMISALTDSGRRGISHRTNITGGAALGDAPDHLHEASQHEPRTGIALTTIVDVVSDTASDSLSDGSQDTITESHTSTASLIRARDSDAELPDFVIHDPETLGLLAMQFGDLSRNEPLSPLTGKALPTTTRRTHGRFFKPSARLPFLLRSRKAIQKVHVYKPVKITILGISESGKSTLAKAMRAGYGDIDESWLRLYQDIVIDNTNKSLEWLMHAAEQKKEEIDLWRQAGSWDAEAFSTHAQSIYPLGSNGVSESSLERIALAVKYLWNHPYIRQKFEDSGTEQSPYLPDCPDFAGQ